MCVTCGCETPGLDHGHDHGHDHAHHHGHGQHPGPGHDHPHGDGPARRLAVERSLLEKNDAYARDNRRRLLAQGILATNLVSSPGAGKTSLLVAALTRLSDRVPAAVVEGDQQTSRDADRIRAAGVPAVQVNTGKGCHLDAHAVGHAIARLAPLDGSLLFIENVGNLVCPAPFDLGEDHKTVILSVTEGEDKPLKYPDIFAAAEVLLLNKVDLLPHLDFDVAACLEYALRVNPGLTVFRTSARTGAGLDAWLQWLLIRQSCLAR